MNTKRMSGVVGLSLILSCFSAPAAVAQHVVVEDAAHDTIDPGLDFTSVNFRNRDRAIVVDFSFVRDRRGEVIFPVRVRGRGVVALVVSQHPRSGDDHLIFQTRHNHDATCKGLRSVWNRAAAELTIRLPSRCNHHGNYGAIKSWALTEGYHSASSDVDYAPQTKDGHIRWTGWIPRG
jgi:hypothetical protein